MDIDELIRRHPRIYHMAADGSWPSIRDRGLLPTTALVELCDVPPALEQDLLRARRPQTIELRDRGGNTISIRDQKPLKLHNLRLVGTDMQGATIFPNSPTRGPHTFQRLAEFQWAGRRSSDGSRGPVVEVTVRDGVPDIADVTLDVQRVEDGRWTVVYRR